MQRDQARAEDQFGNDLAHDAANLGRRRQPAVVFPFSYNFVRPWSLRLRWWSIMMGVVVMPVTPWLGIEEV